MKKGQKIMTITIGLVCFILAYVMCMQFKVVEETNITEIEHLTETELREKQAAWKTRYEETNEKLMEVNSNLQEYKDKRVSNQEATELLNKELLQAQIIAGETDVSGNGIVVTLKDSEDIKIRAENLVQLVNELKLAGAEAICINDMRITNMTDIVNIYVDDGTHFILVNKKRVVSPYVIKAIGDQKYLESALTTKTVGFVEQFSDNATLERQNNIKINKYKGEIKLEYATIKEEN